VEHIKNNPERNVLGTSDEGITRNLASNNEENTEDGIIRKNNVHHLIMCLLRSEKAKDLIKCNSLI